MFKEIKERKSRRPPTVEGNATNEENITEINCDVKGMQKQIKMILTLIQKLGQNVGVYVRSL
jgi:hypothetical protein